VNPSVPSAGRAGKWWRKRPSFWLLVTVALLLLMAVFLVFPFSSLFVKSFLDPDTAKLTLRHFVYFFQTPYYFNTLKHSLAVSTVTTLFATMIGVPLAYAMTRYNVWGKPIINMMIVLSLLSPPFIGAYSWILLLGRNGFVTNLFEQ